MLVAEVVEVMMYSFGMQESRQDLGRYPEVPGYAQELLED